VAYECAFLSESRSTASRLEVRIKRLSREQKLRLIAGEEIPQLELEGYEKVNLE